jgi:hypothetical protein
MSLAELLRATGAAVAEPDDDDTGQNVPESPATLAAQARAVAEGRQRAMMVPQGTDEPPLPRGLARVETSRGVFHYDPAQIGAAEIKAASDARRENEILGLGPASKAEVFARARAGEPVAGVVERQPDGVEVKAAVVTPSTAPAALRELNARAAPGNTVELEPIEGVIEQRKTAARGGGLAALLARTGATSAEPDAAPRQSTARNAANQAGRGALDQGLYSGIEGLSRFAAVGFEEIKAAIPGTAAARARTQRETAQRQARRIAGVIPDGEGASFGPVLDAEDEAAIADAESRAAAASSELAATRAASLPSRYADAVADTRASIRDALPVDEKFARSLGGQIIAGLGQAAGSLPAYAIPGAGPAMSMGQLFDQARADAIASGADEATADLAGFANVPAAALDIAADKLIIGKILRPLRGKLTVSQLATSIAAASAAGGASEAGQQVWANVVARSLAAYDPDRPIDDGVINALIVGAAVAGTTTTVGQTTTQALAPGEAAPASLTTEADSPSSTKPAAQGLAALRAAVGLDKASPAATVADAPPVADPASRERTPVGDPAELVAAQIDARPVEEFRPSLHEGVTGPDVDLISQIVRYGEGTRPEARDPAAAPETFEAFAERMTARFGPKVRAYLAPAWDSGERVGDLNEAAANPLALESTARRALTYGRLFWEGSADVLHRSGLHSLARAVEQHVDLTDRNLALAWTPFKTALAPFKGVRGLARRGEFKQALAEFETYQLAREEGRADDAARILTAASPAGKNLVAATAEAMARTGAENRRLGVRVRDAEGKIRPIGELGTAYFPRVVRPEVADVLTDPSSNPTRWRQMQDELLAAGLIETRAEAADFLRSAVPDDADTLSRGDRFAPLAVARGARLPSSWLRHDFGVVSEYLARWAERAAQIEAFGQKIGPDDLDAFDYAQRATNNENLADYVAKTRAAAYRLTRVPPRVRAALGNVTAATTGLLMGNPYSTARNLIGGVAQTANQLGVLRSFAELRAAFGKAAHADAEAVGVLKADVADLLFQGEGSASVRGLAGLALRVNGFSAAENFVRTHGMLTARAFLRDALALRRERPRSRRALQATAFLQRNGLDIDKLDAEAGRGPETDRFLRVAVRQAQGGYRYDQTPLFTQSPVGRLLFQMQRWGTMATRLHIKHTLAPALVGDVVTVRNPDGTKTRRRVRTLAPLLRSPLVAMAAGVSTYALREAAFGIDRTDQTWEEVFNTLSEDEQRGLELALGRMVNDITMGGTYGAVSSFADTLRWAIKTGEPRSPVEPPSISLALEIVALGRKAQAQGGDLSAQDLREFVGRMANASKYYPALAHSIADKVGVEWEAARRHRAEQDRRLARAAGRRFAETRGYALPEGPPAAPRGSRRAVLYDTLEDALHEGDADAARAVVGEALADIRTNALRAKIRQQVRAAVLTRMPMRPGGRIGRDDLEDFRDWMGRNLPASDREQIEAAQRRFISTAVRAGILSESALDTYAEGEGAEE